MHFATYSIGTIDKDSNPNLNTKIAVGEYLGIWNYVYFGYSAKVRKASVYVKYPDEDHYYVFSETQHFVPNYLGLFVGVDGVQAGFSGFIKNFDLYLGG